MARTVFRAPGFFLILVVSYVFILWFATLCVWQGELSLNGYYIVYFGKRVFYWFNRSSSLYDSYGLKIVLCLELSWGFLWLSSIGEVLEVKGSSQEVIVGCNEGSVQGFPSGAFSHPLHNCQLALLPCKSCLYEWIDKLVSIIDKKKCLLS